MMLSLFLLWPTGSTLGLVLAVVGTGIWLGVQHLNYLEFGEIRRVAQRTIEQRQIFINNLSVRRSIEELKAAASFDQIRNILVAAFNGNDFDDLEQSFARLHVERGKPSVIVADTVRGKGLASMERRADRWFVALTSREAAALIEELHGGAEAVVTSKERIVR